jgi:UDP-3-O-[3-hydroxymyristoyl] glucosamine N-acyltransferase
MEFKLGQIAEILNGRLEGDASRTVSTLAKIEEGIPGALCFLSNPDYTPHIYTTKATAVIVNNDFAAEEPLQHNPALIRVDDARMAFAQILQAYQQMKSAHLSGVHHKALVDESATIAEDAYIGPGAYVGPGSVIGSRTLVHANCTIGQGVKIGNGSIIHAGVIINEACEIGNDVVLQSGVVIGGDGFGFKPNSENNYTKVPHIGNVILEDHVEVGANTTIDRATMGSTIIRKGVKLDNLIQVGHNVEIGENTVIAAQTGIAGSTTIKENCLVGGQVGFVGHITIAPGTKLAAKSGIPKSITEPETIVQGAPAVPIGEFRKTFVVQRQLPELRNKVNEMYTQFQQELNEKA